MKNYNTKLKINKLMKLILIIMTQNNKIQNLLVMNQINLKNTLYKNRVNII